VRAVWGSIAPYWHIAQLLPGVSLAMTLALGAGVGGPGHRQATQQSDRRRPHAAAPTAGRY